jgi:hypothetical protein
VDLPFLDISHTNGIKYVFFKTGFFHLVRCCVCGHFLSLLASNTPLYGDTDRVEIVHPSVMDAVLSLSNCALLFIASTLVTCTFLPGHVSISPGSYLGVWLLDHMAIP